ncbi:hypothetical protein LCAZH_2920 [Lacticaseibacillus paracasei]|nr:Hypothetical protein LOCK919_0052 [Lacticaseibacillus paracasei]EPC16924.1 hypothetical protein Lpp226_2695 [Lacticaseibacillus paracasei subsp. paracasei Lpp226]EPC28283.1 hypothetical protein Lpp46_0472 [Lacticaseibacillus paracasei subsp. paracasei Lpp46]EPC35407.1 hypothetical protein Lpp223_0654 [Lacticaseibacillus paracasei subsp. paracasei Lpp223]AJI44078.1 hypothetical protein LCAZH_2920 [Lacticaseibacillus paracasei]
MTQAVYQTVYNEITLRICKHTSTSMPSSAIKKTSDPTLAALSLKYS